MHTAINRRLDEVQEKLDEIRKKLNESPEIPDKWWDVLDFDILMSRVGRADDEVRRVWKKKRKVATDAMLGGRR